ncbi:hypothetical protein D9611_010142 [Ephemerocybe angulata]|uniref:BTB domain-containing protein n=1 Tax=Ephemerocybe angulata TaxID=980116 RepID=A0A8H5EV88_9AGAR|nr:hypothetical protein D9611_010142 [Tulosesus angulatus]
MATPNQSSSPTRRSPDPYSWWEKFVFKVEDTTFRIPRRGLDKTSYIFADKFRPQTVEGQSDDNPIVLIEGCKSSEFESLLTCLYPFFLSRSKRGLAIFGTTTPGKDDWRNILNLCTTCSRYRHSLIDKDEDIVTPGLKKLVLRT